ncbi:MAG: DNA repair ATPase [Flavobacteriales bacterium]|nr:DNA repair ATPase [Flavobacteriales bacterium]
MSEESQNNQVSKETYEIIKTRLNKQKDDLILRLKKLNENRNEVFGNKEFSLIANERISTEQACKPKDIFSIENHVILGYNVHLGLKNEIDISDIFSVYSFENNTFEPSHLNFLSDANFIDEIKNLYKYYRNTNFKRFYSTENYLYFVFQLSESVSDIKAFKFLIEKEQITYIDSRSASEVTFPQQHSFKWEKATRDMQKTGKFPHVSLANKVFVEAIDGDITIKVEDNTDSGLGIYSEEVQHKDQSLDDAEIHFCDLGNLVIFKIKPYREEERYFIYNHKEKKVFKVDSLENSGILLPENQGIIFPNGYILQNGESKVIHQENQDIRFLKRIASSNGENFLFVYYNITSSDYLILPYSIISQTIDTPISCTGFSIFDDGTLIYLKANEETTKNHLVQLWETPFSKEIKINKELENNLLFKIGNKDLVRLLADCNELITLLEKEDSYSGLYNDIVTESTDILDAYYFLNEEKVGEIQIPLLEIRKIAHSAINEYEKVVEIRKNTKQKVSEVQEKCENILQTTKHLEYNTLTEYIDNLSELRKIVGEIISARNLSYVDISLLDELENKIKERSEELSGACVKFLLQDNALTPYEEKANNLSQKIENLTKAIQKKEIESELDELAFQLELLVDVVNNLKIEDTSQSTEIIQNISVIFSRINTERIELNKKVKEVSSKELSADFQAQITLFDQSVVNFMELANTPEKCDEYLTKLSLSLEELETKFVDFEEFIEEIAEKRENVYNHFQAKKVQLNEQRNKRTNTLFSSAKRILNGIKNKAENFKSETEINGFFASDLMVNKVIDFSNQLLELEDSAKSEEILTLLKTTQQEVIRKLKDKNELFKDGDNIISFGEYKFAINTQKLDLSLVLRENQYYFHLTGTSFYEKIKDESIYHLKEVWNQEYKSENKSVKHFEYLAFQIFSKNKELNNVDKNTSLIQEYMSSNYSEGYVKGIHDSDALQLTNVLQHLHNELGILKFNPKERALAQLFWNQQSSEYKELLEKQFSAIQLVNETLNSNATFDYIVDEVAEKIAEFSIEFQEFKNTNLNNSVSYLIKENRNEFTISKTASDFYLSFLKYLKNKTKDIDFLNKIENLKNHVEECFSIIYSSLKSYAEIENYSIEESYLVEVAVLYLLNNYHENQVLNVPTQIELKELKSLESNQIYKLDYHQFTRKLDLYTHEIVPKFDELKKLKHQLVVEKKNQLKIDSFQSNVLSSFVRNKLINQVYFPLIGANLSKQLGTVGENKRTDKMGMLLLVSPPGYGKTTLMEYLANRLGLIFMKINAPSIGHSITSVDPSQADNSAAKQELEKLNLAFEMGDNVMLYLDDIQHCNPEFLQKFISLADGQRKIEGIYNGESKTYDLRSKRFCLVMAGNPYTESGEKFKIPDMLSNRADIYNLGDIAGNKRDLFDLSLIENALMSNVYLRKLTELSLENLYSLLSLIQNPNSSSKIKGNFSNQEIEDFKSVLLKSIQIRNTVIKVNELYIKSSAMSDDYRKEPVFKLQGSYRDMNKLLSKVQPIQNESEITDIVLEHYQNESQTLTIDAEANLLKLRELMNLLSNEEKSRWEEIKTTFQKNQKFKSLGDNDRMSQIVALLSEFSDGLNGIKDVLKK